MKKISIYCTVAFSLLILMFSCKKENIKSTNDEIVLGRDAGGSSDGSGLSAMLYTEDVIDAGTIRITNDLENIAVTFTSMSDYTFAQTDLFVGPDNAVPLDNLGIAKPSAFSYRTTHSDGVTTQTYTVPVGALYNVGGCGSIAAHAVVVKKDANGNIIEQKHVWGAGVPISANNWASRTPYCLSNYAPYVPQPCPISFKRNNGNGTCGGSGQIRLSFQDKPETAPVLDSIYYEGARIANVVSAAPDPSQWASKGYVSYCLSGGNLPPAKKLVLYFSYPNHQVCSVNE